MEFRPGTCSACKASFRIPASFTADKAKCSKCGGAVEIGPVTNDSSSPQKPSTPPVPAKAVSAPVAGAAARLAAKPDTPAAPVPGAKPAPARAVPASVPAKPALPIKPIGAALANASAPTKPMPKPSQPASAAAKSAGAKAAVAAHQDDDKHGRTGRRARLEKKRGLSPMLLLGALLAFVVIGAGVYMAYEKNKTDNAAKAVKDAAATAERIKQAQDEQAKKDEAERIAEELKAAAKNGAKSADGGVLAAEKVATEPEKVAQSPAADAASAKPAKPVEGFDLSTIPDFGPLEGTTPERWAELQLLAATFVDSSAGARAQRAGTTLEKTPKESFPAILNEFKKLNLEDDAGFLVADITKKMLERICHGNNVGWKYKHEKDWLQYDQKAIKAWCDLWTKASADEAFWKKLIKEGAEKTDPDAAGGGKPVKKTDDF